MPFSKLAIVIPAYKAAFLNECLKSICNQTNKNFSVYIGNDGSEEDIHLIVAKYISKIDIHYFRFRSNIGRQSLVKHWERCIDMIHTEQWIWLFGDDDVMNPENVQDFYNYIDNKPSISNVLRFNLQVINEDSEIIHESVYPAEEDINSYLVSRFLYRYYNSMSNYIFNRNVYERTGFIDFPTGWCSDDASIVTFAEDKPIATLKSSVVQWRASGLNISWSRKGLIQKQKVYARLAFIKWLFNKFEYSFSSSPFNRKIALNWILNSINGEFDGFSKEEKAQLLRETEEIIGINITFFLAKKKVMSFKNRLQDLIR